MASINSSIENLLVAISQTSVSGTVNNTVHSDRVNKKLVLAESVIGPSVKEYNRDTRERSRGKDERSVVLTVPRMFFAMSYFGDGGSAGTKKACHA